MASHTVSRGKEEEEAAGIDNVANVQNEKKETPLVPDPSTNPESTNDEPAAAGNEIKAFVCPSRLITGFNLPVILPVLLEELPPGHRDCLLHATARVGLPLFYHSLAEDPNFPLKPAQIQAMEAQKAAGYIIDTAENHMLLFLSTRSSPIHSGTRHMTLPDHVAPTVMLTRADGKSLEEVQLKALWLFVQGMVMGSSADSSLDVRKKLTPEGFVKFWGDTGMPGECPVGLGCKGCGKKEHGEEGKLMRCGKCGVIRYCGVECQKRDWEAHKKVCVKG